ncbi:enoyl-ACP reductase FabI [Crassaminicella indica]|uniref:Enoyl-[acyl-carrier-protein] reductase [NADH] n=1 Tax=Crassaminicella indica TaxID=2855394 RepID=A0ABX8RDM8_9CLOT|nr:enoyl-ACP reductase FabI [Crassaminicella indica]QXM06397.1 enoyl-ACP reductase FabI [Crassaminicella indica]
MSTLLKDKNILIMGVANKWSIAWAIAKVFHKAGAKLAFTYLGEKTKKSIEKLIEQEGMKDVLLLSCDVTKDTEIENTFDILRGEFETLHGVVHSIAHAKKEELEGSYVDTSRDGYMMAQEVSAYSLVSVAKYAKPLMLNGGSIVALTYLGGERVVKNYNVMGVAKAALEASVKYLAHDLGEENIRVNAISAGPIKTLAAKGIKDFNTMLKAFEEKTPMKRLINTEEIGNTALFLCSDLSSGVTGENIHVDGGYHILGY